MCRGAVSIVMLHDLCIGEHVSIVQVNLLSEIISHGNSIKVLVCQSDPIMLQSADSCEGLR